MSISAPFGSNDGAVVSRPAAAEEDLVHHVGRIEAEVARSCRSLLSHIDRDPYSASRGCADRRYWAWKLVDFPEATFQRNVMPLGWYATSDRCDASLQPLLVDAVESCFSYARAIQHTDGSFDQAFPGEHSFGATGFLLDSVLDAYDRIRPLLRAEAKTAAERLSEKAAEFLCRHGEAHGFISNHLAGAALGLYRAAVLFDNPRFARRADDMIHAVLQKQSPEGWFLEYDGADPGYQTLCVYYLALVARLRGSSELDASLQRAVGFLSWFMHPDGSYGGEYGSRRTAICYPGGLALLAQTSELASRMTVGVVRAIADGKTVSLADVDFGNHAPLLSNYTLLLDSFAARVPAAAALLPYERDDATADFREAGLYARASRHSYTVIGGSNGGVVKVFDKSTGRLLLDDCGYVASTERGLASTQSTDLKRRVERDERSITLRADFSYMGHTLPTPALFLVLRVLNLTVMRSTALGNLIKRYLVRMLIRNKLKAPLTLTRAISFDEAAVVIRDEVSVAPGTRVTRLERGRRFVAIHMASARYFGGQPPALYDGGAVDIAPLAAGGTIRVDTTVRALGSAGGE